MKYMLLIYGDERALDETEREQCYRSLSSLRTRSIRPGNISLPPRCTLRDKMIGGEFEKGLAQMKSVVEAAPKQ